MSLGRNSTLPYRPGDRIRNRHHECGTVISLTNNVMVVELDDGRRVTTSVFEVTLAQPAPYSPAAGDNDSNLSNSC